MEIPVRVLLEDRPWGQWIEFDHVKDHQYRTKRLMVLPGERLSYQKHKHRDEVWTVADGVATVVLDGREFRLRRQETIRIPAGTAHRLWNKESVPLYVVEVQFGKILREDDIERLEDDYGRA